MTSLQFRDAPDRQRAILWAVAAILTAALAFVAWQYVGTVVLGLFVYYVTRPVYVRIQDRIPTRTLAVVASLLLVTLPVILLFAWTLIVAVRQVGGLLESNNLEQIVVLFEPYLDLTEISAELRRLATVVLEDPSRILDTQVNGPLAGVFDVVVGSLGTLFNASLHLFVVFVIAFYLLRDDYRIARWVRGTFVEGDGVVEAYFVAVDRDLKNIYFGNILNVFVTAILGALVYNGLNLFAPPDVAIPQPTLLGLLTGVASLIPVIGMKLVWVPAALILLGRSLLVDPATAWFVVVFALVSVIVVDTIPDQLLRPYVSGRTLHVGAVMLAYILGPLLFGWYGIFFGPFVLVVVAEFARIVLPWLVHGETDAVPSPITEAAPDVEEAGDADARATDDETDGERPAPDAGAPEQSESDDVHPEG